MSTVDEWVKEVVKSRKKDLYMFMNIGTSGLPQKNYGKYYDYKETSRYNGARVIQLSWIVCSVDGEVHKKENHYLTPDGFEISEGSIAIHGVSQQFAQKNGEDYEIVLDMFMDDLEKATTVISHNLEFDYNVLSSESFRHDNKKLPALLNATTKICTGISTKDLLMLDNGKKDYKMPKLSELYEFCYKKELKLETNNVVMANLETLVKIFFYLKMRYKFGKK